MSSRDWSLLEESPLGEGPSEALFDIGDDMSTRQGKWVKITAVADSGAVTSTMADHAVPFIKERGRENGIKGRKEIPRSWR